MMRIVVSLMLILAALLLQTTLIPYIAISGVQPDLVLMVVIAYAFMGGSLRGSVVGFVSGLLQDLLMGFNLGFSAGAKTIIGYLAGLMQRSVLLDSVFLPAFSVFAATLTHDLLLSLLSAIFGLGPELNDSMANLLPSALYNAVLGIAVFPLIRVVVVRAEGAR